MKCSVFTVCTPDVSPEELIEIARNSGIRGVEWRYKDTSANQPYEAPSYWSNNHCTLDPVMEDWTFEILSEKVKLAGLSTIALTPYLTAGDLSATEHAMRHASLLGASMMRVGVASYKAGISYHEAFRNTKAYLDQVQVLSKRYGVKALVETHHETIAPSASLAYRLVSGFDPNLIGVLYDPGNMVHEGFEHYRMGLELLGDYLAHVHVKNAGWFPPTETFSPTWTCRWQALEQGMVDWKQVISDLKSVGYSGWFGVEDFSGTRSTPEMLSFYKQWFSGLAQQAQEG